ncbi:MAG: hypothetical protein JWM57_2319, partial [Phycisphaerales bacterium]|nr:hypothetical protein [Phycisphaerales bacterium]
MVSARRFFALALFLLPSFVHAQWTAELGRDATTVIRYDGSRVMSFNYIAWGPAWKYADFKPTLGKDENGAWPIKGEIKTLNTTVGGTIRYENGSVIYEWKLSTAKSSTGNIGGA